MRALASKTSIGIFALLLPVVSLVAGLPARPLILGVINNAAHGPLFGLFAILVALYLRSHTNLPRRSQYVLSFVMALLVGGMVELIQPLIGRDSQIGDIFVNSVGAAGGLGALALATSHRKVFPGVLLAASSVLIGWPIVDAILGYMERARQAPTLLELSTRADWYFLSIHGMNTSKSVLPRPFRRIADPASIRCELADDSRRSIHDLEPINDWSDHRVVVLDLTNPGTEALDLTFRVHDLGHNNQPADRFNRSIRLPGTSRIAFEIPLAEIRDAPQGRKLDLTNVAGWILFASSDAVLTGQVFYITRIWLE